MSLKSVLTKAKSEALATVHAAQTMLNRYPDLDLNNFSMSAGTSANPFPFLVELLKSTAGYDYVIRSIGLIIASAIPALEITVKTLLLAHMRNLISCSFDPFIPDEILENGMVFPLDRIDPQHILEHSPLKAREYGPRKTTDGFTYEDSYQDSFGQDDKMVEEMGSEASEDPNYEKKKGNLFSKAASFYNKYAKTRSTGSYYYFGTEHFTTPDELKYAGDFNAFLWYVKHRAPGRASWHGVKLLQATVGDSSWGSMRKNGSFRDHKSRDSYCVQKKPKDTDYYNPNSDGKKNQRKDRKGAGIITLEYRDNAKSFRTAEGNRQTGAIPYNNAIQLMIGCTEERDNSNWKPLSQEKLNKANEEHEKAKNEYESSMNALLEKEAKVKKKEEKYNEFKTQGKETGTDNNKDTEKQLKEDIKAAKKDLKAAKKEVEEKNKAVAAAWKNVSMARAELEEADKQYVKVEHNYYHNHTLAEFNFDYITSLKLFDAKVIVAMLLDNITGCLGIDINVNLSYERKVIEEEVEKIVQKFIEVDDVDTISDCFFTFTNEGYDAMLRKVEMMQSGLIGKNGNAAGRAPSADYLLEGVDSISSNSSLEEVSDQISKTLKKVVPQTEDNGSGEGGHGLEGSFSVSFIENILTELAKVIVMTLITPKVYILFAVNLKVLDMDDDFSMSDFLSKHRSLFAAMVKGVRDLILNFIYDQLKQLIIDLAVGEAKLLAQEQAEMYKRLLRQCIECLNRWRGRGEDFQLDNVDYADIEVDETNSDVPENVC